VLAGLPCLLRKRLRSRALLSSGAVVGLGVHPKLFVWEGASVGSGPENWRASVECRVARAKEMWMRRLDEGILRGRALKTLNSKGDEVLEKGLATQVEREETHALPYEYLCLAQGAPHLVPAFHHHYSPSIFLASLRSAH
jgi:hypothetical protein